MKIGLVAPGGFDRSGTERVLPIFLWFVERLARRHEVHVFTLQQYPWPAHYPLVGAQIHNVGEERRRPRLLRLMTSTLQMIWREHAAGGFDVFHGLWASQSGLAAALAGRLFRAPCVVSVVGGELARVPQIDYGSQLSIRARMTVAVALRLAQMVTVESPYNLELVRRLRRDALLAPFGVDTDLFSPPTSPPPHPPWTLLHVASLNRVKDQPTLLRAFARIHAVNPNTRLDIVGMDTLNGAIHRLAAELELGDSVQFHGFQPSGQVADFMARSHLLLHSSLHEAGEVVTLEAAAAGLPTVGTAVGHVAQLAPGAAFAVPVGDDRALAAAVLDLLADPIRRRQLGRNALAWARAHNADWSTAQYEVLYTDLICGVPSGTSRRVLRERS
ncbi:MAG TPA: glycosyltransferase [Armatimonadota bacterium]|nr:glycosyltransferase [Armatimonadota bacterium]